MKREKKGGGRGQMLWVKEGGYFLFTDVLLRFSRPRGTAHAFLFLLVPLYSLIPLTAIAYIASQAAIVLTLTLFNRLNFI